MFQLEEMVKRTERETEKGGMEERKIEIFEREIP
jgi:hypothetical protein